MNRNGNEIRLRKVKMAEGMPSVAIACHCYDEKNPFFRAHPFAHKYGMELGLDSSKAWSCEFDLSAFYSILNN